MTDFYSGIYKSLIIASVVAFIISFFTSAEVSLGAELSGYCVLILGIMMILLILIKNIFKFSKDTSSSQTLMSILMNTGPFFLMLGVIGFIMYLLIVYKQRIIDGHVSNSYTTFSKISIVLFLLQIYIVYTNISTDKFESTGKMTNVTCSLIYLLGVLTTISSLILFTILKYFTTDG